MIVNNQIIIVGSLCGFAAVLSPICCDTGSSCYMCLCVHVHTIIVFVFLIPVSIMLI